MDAIVVDLSQYDREIEDRRKHHERFENALRESARQYLKHVQDDGESAIDYIRDLIRHRADVSFELKELEDFGNSLVMMAGMLRRECRG